MKNRKMTNKKVGVIVLLCVIVFVFMLLDMNAVLGLENPYQSFGYYRSGGISGDIDAYTYEKVGNHYYYQHVTKSTVQNPTKRQIPSSLFHLKGILVRCMNFERDNGYSEKQAMADGISYQIYLQDKNGNIVSINDYGTTWSLESKYPMWLIKIIF